MPGTWACGHSPWVSKTSSGLDFSQMELQSITKRARLKKRPIIITQMGSTPATGLSGMDPRRCRTAASTAACCLPSSEVWSRLAAVTMQERGETSSSRCSRDDQRSSGPGSAVACPGAVTWLVYTSALPGVATGAARTSASLSAAAPARSSALAGAATLSAGTVASPSTATGAAPASASPSAAAALARFSDAPGAATGAACASAAPGTSACCAAWASRGRAAAAPEGRDSSAEVCVRTSPAPSSSGSRSAASTPRKPEGLAEAAAASSRTAQSRAHMQEERTAGISAMFHIRRGKHSVERERGGGR
mmetsp:Transcript_29774/g.75786  ORF Transcript_29774/g.75786 Transcript_29774/m.75786 type:complete len:306 (-) Transcript_29774:35-952(-)